MADLQQVWQDLDVDEDGTNVRTSLTLVHRIVAFNAHTTDTCYLQLFEDTIGDVTVGTTSPDLVIPVPAGVVVDVGIPLKFAELSIAATAGPTNAVAPGDDPIVTVFYG